MRSAANVLINKPELMSSTRANATCTTTKTPRVRCRSLPSLIVRPPALKADAMRGAPYFRTGMSPKNTPDNIKLKRAHIRTNPSVVKHRHTHARGRRELVPHDRPHPSNICVGLLQCSSGLQACDRLIAEVSNEHPAAIQSKRKDNLSPDI